METTSGTGEETLSYLPYGGVRVDAKAANFASNQKLKYAQTQNDVLSGLNYAQARYQDPTQGRFISEDPIFNGVPNRQNLADPQSLNAYSYAEDNPIVKSDPSGKCIEDLCIGEAALVTAAIETQPEWGPVLQEEANNIVNVFNGNFPIEQPTNLIARTEQVVNGSLENFYLNGGNRLGEWVDWFKNSKALPIATFTGGLTGAYCAFTDCTKSSSIFITNPGSNSNGGANNLYGAQPPSSNSGSRSGGTQSAIGGSSSGGGLTPQQTKNIQSQINQIQNAINNIRNIINASSGSKK